jgi:hypothetical protein
MTILIPPVWKAVKPRLNNIAGKFTTLKKRTSTCDIGGADPPEKKNSILSA